MLPIENAGISVIAETESKQTIQPAVPPTAPNFEINLSNTLPPDARDSARAEAGRDLGSLVLKVAEPEVRAEPGSNTQTQSSVRDFAAKVNDLYVAKRAEIVSLVKSLGLYAGLTTLAAAGTIGGAAVMTGTDSLIPYLGGGMFAGMAAIGSLIAATWTFKASRDLFNRTIRSPLQDTSPPFEQATRMHYGPQANIDVNTTYNNYLGALKLSTSPVLHTKCAHGMLEIIRADPNPVGQANKCTWMLGELSPALNGSNILKEVAGIMLAAIPVWMPAVTTPTGEEATQRANWIEIACKRAFKEQSAEGTAIATQLVEALLATNSATSGERQFLLGLAHRLADRNSVVRGNTEELMLANAMQAEGDARFELIQTIAKVPGLSTDSMRSAGQLLDTSFDTFNPANKLVANELIRKWLPNNYAADQRAEKRADEGRNWSFGAS